MSAQNEIKQAKANEPQAFQNWNEKMNTAHEGMESTIDKSIQLQSKNLQFPPNPKLLAIQRMAVDFDQRNKGNIQLKKNNSGLPDTLKSGVESLSGLSMDDVKVHYNSDKPAQLNAHAYAQGTDIHLASGQEKHLPHEAWHVVQQKQGRVQPTMMLKAKVPINDDQDLEKEADIMGTRALQMKPFSLSDYRTKNSVQKKGVVQKVDDDQIEEYEDQLAIDTPGRDAIGSLDELDNDLDFKSSDGIEDVKATNIPLPKHKGISKAFHTTTNKYAANSILQRIDPRFHNPASRFGGGFYVASDLQTCYAELKAHEVDQFKDDYELKPGESPEWLSAVHTIEYDVSGGDLVDCTSGKLAELVKTQPLAIEKKVREDKRDGIVFPSTKGSGMNIVLFQNYGILKSTSDEPSSAKEGFGEFKKEKLSEKMDKMQKDGGLSKIKRATDTGETGTI